MTTPSTVTLSLIHPVTVDGTVHSTLTFRRMKAKDTLLAEGEENKVRAGYRVFAALADVDLAVIEDLDIEDIEAIAEAIVPLMGKSAARAATAGQTIN